MLQSDLPDFDPAAHFRPLWKEQLAGAHDRESERLASVELWSACWRGQGAHPPTPVPSYLGDATRAILVLDRLQRLEQAMWVRPAGFAILLALTACASRSQETSTVATDTTVTSRRVVDTTLVRTDTTVTVDTTKIEGGSGVAVDTTDAAGRVTVDTTTAE